MLPVVLQPYDCFLLWLFSGLLSSDCKDLSGLQCLLNVSTTACVSFCISWHARVWCMEEDWGKTCVYVRICANFPCMHLLHATYRHQFLCMDVHQSGSSLRCVYMHRLPLHASYSCSIDQHQLSKHCCMCLSALHAGVWAYHLAHYVNVDTLREYCEVAIETDSLPNMQSLVRNTVEELQQGGWPEICTLTCGWWMECVCCVLCASIGI